MTNSPARSTVDVGSVIAGTYTIEAMIGRGGMGAVFLASHNRLPGKRVAIKLLHVELTDDEVIARFRREAMIASQLDHPNIVRVDDYNVTADGTPYLVLEYLQGESLAQRIKQGPMPLDQAMSIIRQVGSAMAAAHREGIVHRDLKPQNIFLVPTEVDGRIVEIAKVLDFGISKIRGSQTVKTQESSLLGTPQYMAPEQATGQHTQVDERTDVFALGAIVYEMLCGEPAFTGDSIPEVVFKVVYEQPAPLEQRSPTVPATIVRAVIQAMAKPSAERFASVSAFVEALTGLPLASSRPSAIAMPDAGATTGSGQRSTGKEAFAQTMGSGDHGGAAMAATSAPGLAVSSGPAASPASVQARSIPPRDGAVTPQAETVVSSAAIVGPPVEPAPQRRPIGVIVGLSLACLASAGVAIYFATRDPGPAASKRAAADAAQPIAIADAAVSTLEPDAAIAVTTADAAVPPADAAVIARVTDPDRVRPPRRPTDQAGSPGGRDGADDDEGDDGGDPGLRDQLKRAQVALARQQYDLAERLANGVINSDAATPRQSSRARRIHGVVECRVRNNEEGARIDLRNIKHRDQRRLLLRACHKVNLLRSER